MRLPDLAKHRNLSSCSEALPAHNYNLTELIRCASRAQRGILIRTISNHIWIQHHSALSRWERARAQRAGEAHPSKPPAAMHPEPVQCAAKQRPAAREGSSWTQYGIQAIPSNHPHEDPSLTLGIHNKKLSAGEHDTPVRRNLKSKICNQKFPYSPNSSPIPSRSSSGQARCHSVRIQRSISGGRAWMPGAYASGWRAQASSAITWAASGGST